MITERDISVLLALARYFVLNRVQLQRLSFPSDKNGRVTRKRLRELLRDKFINRQPVTLHDMDTGTSATVYYPARRGIEYLAERFDDDRFLQVSTQAPQPYHVPHCLAVAATHITIDEAIARQQTVKLECWINEWDTLNGDEQAPEKRYRLYTLLRESPRLVCAPDAAFMLSLGTHRKVFYLEQDMNTSGVRRIAASKTRGYAEMATRQLHRRHFPDSTIPTFIVLMVAPNPVRRDRLRKAIRTMPGAELWRFVSTTDLTAANFLHAPIIYRCDGGPASIVKPDHKPESDTRSIAEPAAQTAIDSAS